MSQNGAIWLAANAYHHEPILRFFYGEDIIVRTLDNAPREKADPVRALSNPIGGLIIAAVGLILKEGF
jgi:hypothetical protein